MSWTESLHPRHPSGESDGGEFAPKDGTSAYEDAKVAENQRQRERAKAERKRRVDAAFATKDPSRMTNSEIEKEMKQLDLRSSRNTQDFIAAGRGHERPSEYLSKSDPLSTEAREIHERQKALRMEAETRYGPDGMHWLQGRRGGARVK